MSKFDGLYSSKEASIIYGFHESYIRKKIELGHFVDGQDVKKFGNTWVITEEALISTFGKLPNCSQNQIKEFK